MRYWICLAGVAAIAFFFALPDATAAIGMLTFGVGFLVSLIAINLLPLLLCFLPVKLFPKGRKWLGLLVSVALYTAYLFGPGTIADRQARAWIAGIQSQNTQPNVELTAVRTFELHFDIEGIGTLCRKTCKSLIAGGDADWVRVIFSNRVSATFAPEPQNSGDCRGLCIQEIQDSGEPADLVIAKLTADQMDLPDPPLGGLFTQVSKQTRVEAFLSEAGSAQPIYRQTAVRYRGIDNVLIWIPRFTGTGSEGYEAGFGAMRGSETSIPAALRDMGWATSDVTRP